MKAIDRHFTKLINGTTQFVIPVFQRDYSWGEQQCAQLWNDVVRIGGDQNARGHFIGSVVYVPSGDTAAGFTRWLLIDGQQRLTTVTVLLIALRDHLVKTNWQPSSDDDPTPKRVDAYFLKNLQEEGDRQQKLVLRRQDQAALKALVDGKVMEQGEDSRVLENYEFFREAVEHVDPAILYRGIGRLIVVDVALDRGADDPQMIFESLNSTGLDLSQADLIRNFILMRKDERNQTRLYEEYWRKIEDLFRGASSTFDRYARDYMTLKTHAAKQARGDQVYHEFRHFFHSEEEQVGTDKALGEMHRYARYYAAFSGTGPASASIAALVRRLNRLAEVTAIVVMRLLDCHERCGTMPEKDLIEALTLLESYVFRRSVCAMQTRAYNQFFPSLAQRISDDAPLETLKVALAASKETYRFPSDEEFGMELERRDLYSMRNCHYMLDRLENFDNNEPTDTTGYTIEHVLPQNERLGRAWREMLGPDWRNMQETWVHRLGNLTLTGYNSTYSDRPFDDKKTIAGGFSESAVRLNRFIREQSQWTAEEIASRGSVLAKSAIAIWPALRVSSDALKLSRRTELEKEAALCQLDAVPMSTDGRQLFEHLRSHILSIDPKIIEVVRSNSIAYYADDGDYFLEVLPRKRRLTLLLPLALGECAYRDEFVADATDLKFIVNARHEGGVFYSYSAANQTEGALRLVRQAYELAAL
jgi:uncharacterized protein with ParB-like and HNH nuclease domain/predicted transport protein